MAWSIAEALAEDPIVVTGRGAVSTCGLGVRALLEAAREGRPGGKWVEIAGVKYPGCLVSGWSGKGMAKRLDPGVQFALEAAREALGESGWANGLRLRGKGAAQRFGVIAGTSRGCQAAWEQAMTGAGAGKRSRPTMAATTTLAALSGAVAHMAGAGGPGLTVSATCASGAFAIAMAAEQLLLGNADVMLAGGADAVQNRLVFPGMAAAGLLGSHVEAERACRPFEASRDGLILGEGAGFLVLERLSHAAARGAEVLGMLAGWAVAVNEAAGKTGLSGDGAILEETVRRAMNTAGFGIDGIRKQVVYINAHGTGTPLNDAAEVAAMRAVFGDLIPPMSSTKPVTGHCLGATPVMEAIIAMEVLRSGWLPPQAGWTVGGLDDGKTGDRQAIPDPALGPLNVPVGAGRIAGAGMALSNSLGFWGYHAALLFGGKTADC